MAAKLILVLAFGFLVTDAYRPITFTMKRQDGITTVDPPSKPPNPNPHGPHTKGPPAETIDISKYPKKNLPQYMDENELRSLDFWRTLLNYLEEQPVIILSEQGVEKQLEYIQDPKSEYY